MASFYKTLTLAFIFLLGFGATFGEEEEPVQISDSVKQIVREFQEKSAKTADGWSSDIAEWEAPEDKREELIQDMPFYVAGYDYEKRPVIVWELGKWKCRKYVDGTKESRELAYKHAEKKWFLISNISSPYPEAETGIFLIMDSTGFQPSEIASIEAVKFHLHGTRIAERIEQVVERFYIVNLNFVGQTWLNIVRPVGGRWLGKAVAFGPSKTKAALKEYIPPDQLPPWYGGNENYKPIKVYG